MSQHEPTIRSTSDGSSCSVDCSCGWSDPYLWSHEVGARTAFLEHVVRAHFPASWPGSFSVDYDPDERGAPVT